MATLILRLVAPMQSWGTQSRFAERDSGREPSKSGVIGLLCAALGRSRDKPLDDLRKLRMGVRVDYPGAMMRDFQTTQGVDVEKKPGKKPERKTVISKRYYLSDAEFIVGLEHSDAQFLQRLYDAIANPVWELYLGRKSFVPSQPILPMDVGFPNPTDMELEEALASFPYRPRPKKNDPGELLTVIEITDIDDEDYLFSPIRVDQPRSFAERTFEQRRVRLGEVTPPILEEQEEEVPCTSHD